MEAETEVETEVETEAETEVEAGVEAGVERTHILLLLLGSLQLSTLFPRIVIIALSFLVRQQPILFGIIQPILAMPATTTLAPAHRSSSSSSANLGRYSSLNSSYSITERFFFTMPFSCANFCHLVSGLALGICKATNECQSKANGERIEAQHTGFSRGVTRSGFGSSAIGPRFVYKPRGK